VSNYAGAKRFDRPTLRASTLVSVMEQFRPPHQVQRDTELALAFREGNLDAVRTLYERFGGLVFTVAHRIIGDGQRVEDVTQHVFVQAWRLAGHFDAGRDFAPWLAMIARSSAIDALRIGQRSPTEALDHADPSDSALVMLPPSAKQVETVWSVRTAIDSLDPNEREVIRMQHLQGHSHSEIAEQLGVAVGTVESRSDRGHRRLATRLGHLGQDVEQ
jgi:RNA polymerase sigma-70 factor (ECF subfamily)